MSNVISNTSPLLYLYRIEVLAWLPQLFNEIWAPPAVVEELKEGQNRGYHVPIASHYHWLQIVEPQFIPSEWLSLDLGKGERAVMALGLENPERIVILDDGLARRIAQAAGLEVWGTLKILLEAKNQGLTEKIAPLIDQMIAAGMWLSMDIRHRILKLAGEETT